MKCSDFERIFRQTRRVFEVILTEAFQGFSGTRSFPKCEAPAEAFQGFSGTRSFPKCEAPAYYKKI